MTDAVATDRKALTRTARDPAATPAQLHACASQGDAIDRLLARHPNASAQLLAQLSHSSDRATRKAVTRHPNTPKETLLKLAPQFPGDFFKNPAFDWLLIEHPTLLLDIGGGVLKNLLKCAECPQSFMAWAAEHGSEQERLAVAMNPQAQVTVLQAIERRGGKAAQAAQQHANHPLASGEGDLESVFKQALEQAIADGFTAKRVPTLAQQPVLSLCERLGPFLETCVQCAVHPLAPPALATQILTRLARDSDREARWTVACNPAVPSEILTSLANDSDQEVRCTVAANPSTPVDIRSGILTDLAGDPDEEVRCLVAKNMATPATVLASLAMGVGSDVGRAAACNPSTPADVLRNLAGDADSRMRGAVACNHGAPVAILAKLASDSSFDVRYRAAENTATPASSLTKLAEDSSETVQCAVARNAATPLAALATLATSSNKYVRRAVAENLSCPQAIRADIFSNLAADPDLEMRCWIAEHPATPTDILTKLSRSTEKAVRYAVASNSATPDAILTKLGGDKAWCVRCEVAKNPSTPIDTLTKLAAAESHWPMCQAIAGNPAAPAALINSASEDAYKMVFDYRQSTRWASQLANIKSKDADLVQACVAGDVLFLPDRLAEKACRKTDLAWRLLGLSHRLALPKDLARRSRSTEWVERMAVARNPNTPPNVIEALRKDPNRLVSRQAMATAALKATGPGSA